MNDKVSIENALCFNLYSASRAMTQMYRPILKDLGLTYPQFLVMILLWQSKEVDVTVKDLGSRLFLDSGTLTPLLKRLEGLDFVKRTKSKKDEREVFISLTRKGSTLEKKSESVAEVMFCNLDVSMERFVEVRDGVREILTNLHKKLDK